MVSPNHSFNELDAISQDISKITIEFLVALMKESKKTMLHDMYLAEPRITPVSDTLMNCFFYIRSDELFMITISFSLQGLGMVGQRDVPFGKLIEAIIKVKPELMSEKEMIAHVAVLCNKLNKYVVTQTKINASMA